MKQPPLRIAFTLIPRRLHAGGFNYLQNLFVALDQHRPGELAPVVFAGLSEDDTDLSTFASIPGVTVVENRAFERGSLGLMDALLTGLDHAAAAAFRSEKIDVVFEHARFFGWRLSQPAVAWFPDLQHKRLPHLFSTAGRWHREIGFRAQIAAGRSILLSSESALHDCETFYPGTRSRASVVRFASHPTRELLAADPCEIINLYGLPKQYFYLPNQFWRHKNHQLVLDALAILAERRIDVVVAVSGSPDDPPDHFAGIMNQVEERKLGNGFRYLGMIPLAHVYALLRASLGLINPSQFEGWSTTVEEAKSFDVPLILSDLDVHREQTEGRACYFGVDDATALAECLANAVSQPKPFQVRQMNPMTERKVAAFASDFVATIQRAWSIRKANNGQCQKQSQ